MNGEYIPLDVMRLEIKALNSEICCDQACQYTYTLLNALRTVCDWYNSPSYKKRLRICRNAKIVNDTAKWEEVPDDENESFMRYPKCKCSNCGIEVFAALAKNDLYYCSNCGAFMREDLEVGEQDGKESRTRIHHKTWTSEL